MLRGVFFFFAVMMCGQGRAESVTENLSIYGDFRLRLESDFDSVRASGAERDDRTRLRARARLGFAVTPAPHVEVGVRLRSGADDSHQSPHITLIDFDDNDTGDADFNLDKWYFRYTRGNAALTTGRSSIAFWKQNEILFDDDVTPAGMSYALALGRFGVNAGYYTLPVGMQEFAGNLAVLQGTLDAAAAGGRIRAAIGFAGFDAQESDPDAVRLVDGNGLRDYGIWSMSGQFQRGETRIGVDYFVNVEDYSSADPDAFTAFHRDEDTGFVLSASHGGTASGDWLFAIYYLRLETFAVNSTYAQDDWVRFGTATESRASNIEGFEFRIGYGLASNMNLIFRTYVVDAIRRRGPASVAREDGTRLRLDFNFKF